MIEINLVPDVKQELIRAQRVRTSVISMAVIVGVVAVGLVVVLAIWVYAVQAGRSYFVDKEIKDSSNALSQVKDINNTLTIQNQLSKLSSMHSDKMIDSRIFDVLQTVNPPAPNDIRVTNLQIDAASSTVTIQGQAANGYAALDVFKKTLSATTVQYTQNGQSGSVPLVSSLNDADRSYGEDANGAKVLRFTISFVYPKELFAATIPTLTIQAPSSTNATDSFRGIPTSLFVEGATDAKGTQ